jgi:outer membrane lipoprotein
MKMRFMKPTIFLLGLALVTLSGCATYPVAKNLRQQAKPVTLAQATENPGAHAGTVVIWGGRIIKTDNATNGGTLYVLKLPLDGNGKPQTHAESPGRFIANSPEFLNPEMYQRGHLVTVAGTLAGLETGLVQKASYTYPVVSIKQAHVWPVEASVIYYNYPAGYWGGYYWGGYYYPYYPGWSYYPRRGYYQRGGYYHGGYRH